MTNNLNDLKIKFEKATEHAGNSCNDMQQPTLFIIIGELDTKNLNQTTKLSVIQNEIIQNSDITCGSDI